MALADDFMRKAERALATARLMTEHGAIEGACGRAYYAMFHAAQAALLTVGTHPDEVIVKTHRGLIASFGEHLVLPGHVDPALGRSFSAGPSSAASWPITRATCRPARTPKTVSPTPRRSFRRYGPRSRTSDGR